MFEPDSPAYYAAMFGSLILVPILLGTSVLFGLQAWRHRTRGLALLAGFLGVGVILAILANPLTYVITIPISNARVASMQEEVQRSGLIGAEVEDFIGHFGEPDEVVPLQAPRHQLLVYTCIPRFAYGWDELHVYADESGRITGTRIDD